MNSENGQNKSKRNIIISLVLVAVIALTGLWYLNYYQADESENTQTVQRTEEQTESFVEEQAESLVTISDDGKTVSYQGVTDQNALELLKQYTTTKTDEYPGLGEYVVTINAVTADSTNNYWSFYVNGEAAQVGAGDYETKDTDVIEWRLEDVSSFNQ